MRETPADALSVSHVSKTFGTNRVVTDVSFSIAPGEILALVGENGAGKSTLMNMISGTLEPDSGEVHVAAPADDRGRAVAMVHQELSLFDNLTVAENLEFDSAGRRPLISEAASRAHARAVLAQLGVDIDPDATVGTLSAGQRQLVEVAKAIAIPPTLLILDEPTSSLEGPQVELLFAAVRRLVARGTAVMFVSHRMDELFELCSRVLIMRDGVQVEFGELAGHTRASLVASMVGRETTSFYPQRRELEGPADELAALDGVTVDGRVHDVSLSFPAGTITAIAGLDGHGQTEVAEVLAGARKPSAGGLRLGGVAVRFPSPHAAVRNGVCYVPPNRRLDGLLLDKPVSDNMLLAASAQHARWGFAAMRRNRRTVLAQIEKLAIRCSSLFQPVIELSGGNQQKVLISRWLIYAGLRVLVLNDPTRGVDVGARAQIYDVVREIADRGVAVVLVSTDLEEILGLSDQIYVMYSGEIKGLLSAQTATEESVMHLATGGDVE